MIQEWLSTQPAAAAESPSNESEAEIVHQDNIYGMYFYCKFNLFYKIIKSL